MIAVLAAASLTLTSLLLFAFGANLLYLAWRATRLRRPRSTAHVEGDEPVVCVQLPIYNERYVAERVLDAVCSMDWPRDRLEVQVLDDSDDDTADIIARRARHWRQSGADVAHVRRGSREGFKAGALTHGLALTQAPLIAIFDADFVPPRDFLRRMCGAFEDPRVGFAQARWGHLDERYSLFTRLQAMAIDFHFLVEQSVRSTQGFFTNFTGTAGIWRREAIEDSGGWSARTLTEDLDLSYRAQLRGWNAAYVEDLVVPEELPVSIHAYRRQQSRWATGSFQSAFRLLWPVLRSRHRAAVKLEAVAHLVAYGVGPVMLIQLACYPLFLVAFGGRDLHLPWYVTASSAVAIGIGVSPWLGFIVARMRRGEPWWTALPSFLCQVVGAGMSLNSLVSLVRAFRPGGTFTRTPKHHITATGQEWRHHAYVEAGDMKAVVEGLLGLAAAGLVVFALAAGQVLIAVYSSLFAIGFLLVASLSLAEYVDVATLRGFGRRARRPLIAGALFAASATLLVLAARMPEPFEDGYGHWLIAANLASTGQLHDPLFGMEDTWLPAYHLLAAAVLKVFGLWQLGALKLLSAALGLVTAACVYGLAPNRRQATTAVVLLVLNPVFLFTSGSAVVEPLLTALLSGAALAAVRGRLRLAALLAALACATSTKAWIWVGAAVGFAVLEALRTKRPATARVAWAVPAVAVLALVQLGFAPASHSVARGSIEVVSATARGGIPAGAVARVLELGLTYGLAALPILVFAAAGVLIAIRSGPAAMWRLFYVPAGVYLAAVFALVAAGDYTGSHRYLYPALPALALLAAGALDRYGTVMTVAAAAASSALAIAFIPVFFAFAGSTTGLLAAGRSVAASPGVLLTDSPEVAYYSGRPPAEITGSQSLPASGDAAVAWMRVHRVSALVLEDVSYYRATAVFPELAAGTATPPFVRLAQAWVAGDKPVFAYRLMPGFGLTQTEEGKTAPLAKGVTLGPLGTGEGMGFGVPIVHYPDGWVYARSSTTTQVAPDVWRRTFELDTIGGDNAHAYRFVPVAVRGEIEVTYRFDSTGVAITVTPLWLAPGYVEAGVLNEQGALFDDFASKGAPTETGASFGRWVPVDGSWARLRSESLALEWSVPSLDGARLYGGRELAPPDFDWAGLDYVFAGPFRGATYQVTIQEAR